jgi:threonine 3-dehydrogenase
VKALAKSRAERGLWLEEVPEPSIGINDVKIRVLKAGICGTDLHIYEWDAWASANVPVGLTIGHEFVGEIVEVGANVVDFAPGQVVSGEGHVVCGRCRNCLAGRRHLCAHTEGVGVDLDVAAIFDPLGNAVHTALAFPCVGEDVLVTGAGPIGIMAAAVARRAGARRVVISDPNPYRRRLAETVGVTLAVDPKATTLREVQQQLGMQEGFDVGLEMSGHPAAFREMLENMSHGAKIAMLGIPAEPMAIDWNRVIFNQLTLRGIYGREMYETWYKMTVLLESGLDISGVITHRLGYRDFEKGFEAMKSGESGKVILDWRG